MSKWDEFCCGCYPLSLNDAHVPLSAYCVRLLEPLLHEHKCLIGEVFAGGRKKPRNVVAARNQLIRQLRETVGTRGSHRSCNAVIRIFPDGVPSTWKRLSTPLMGRLIGLDHSTVVLSLERSAQAETSERKSVQQDGPVASQSAPCAARTTPA